MTYLAQPLQRVLTICLLLCTILLGIPASRSNPAAAAQLVPNPHRATPLENKPQSAPAYGLYSAVVISRPDPHMRVQIEVPTLGISGEWASACLPVGSTAVPPLQSRVWVMFEQGNTHFPVWMGVSGN